MRMHRKAHLDERILSCSDILTVANLEDKNMSRAAAVKEYLNLQSIFGNSNPVRLEIGCGKGSFICTLAQRERDINFVAVEKISNVLIEAAEAAKGQGIKNVHFLNCAAEVLPKYFRHGSVQQIYLNFSNPLPKLGYVKQRLTHPKFLDIYRGLLVEGGIIVQKTDDEAFFNFSLESYKSAGYKILEVCTDLAAAGDAQNIVTEHEKKFMQQGKKIYRLTAQA